MVQTDLGLVTLLPYLPECHHSRTSFTSCLSSLLSFRLTSRIGVVDVKMDVGFPLLLALSSSDPQPWLHTDGIPQ